MNAMNSATDNAKELRKVLLVKFNKARQAKITQVRRCCLCVRPGGVRGACCCA
jgi:hypothetical protein